MSMNWKKIAEAFMRAIERPDATRRGKKLIDDAADRAWDKNESGMREGISRGMKEGDDMAKFAKRESSAWMPEDVRPSKERAAADDFEERITDKNLQTDFEKAFDEAAENYGYKKWREESKDMPLDDGFGGDLHDVDREDAVQRAREQMIEDLKSGMPISDVLKKYGE